MKLSGADNNMFLRRYLHDILNNDNSKKSINGLVAFIGSDINLPLASGTQFLFINKQRDKMIARLAKCNNDRHNFTDR